MKRALYLMLVGSTLGLAGCYQKVSQNGNLEFSYQLWVPSLIVLAGLAAIPAGALLFFNNQRFWGVILAIAGPVAIGVIAPGMFLDKAVVNQEGFYSSHGFWWNRTVHDIKYADLQQVHYVIEERQGRRGKNYSHFFDCTYKSGKQERVPLGDVMREALPEIAQQFRANGVPVHMPANAQN